MTTASPQPSPPDSTPISYHAIDEALLALREGKMIIVVDSQDRENEGDLVCAAEKITPDIVSFMLRHAAGMLCVPLSSERADLLQLNLLVERNTSLHQTNMLMLVDHRDSGTGISAESRARTVQALADPQARAEDFVRPGHITPLLAKDAGVLRRAGHTEATVDLLKMAGMQPVGCLIEILSPTGNGMATRADLQTLSAQHGFPIICIDEIIRHRRLSERLVSREVETRMPTKYGDAKVIAYRVEHEDQEPLAIVFGDLASVPAPMVRMHSSCFTGDLVASLRCDCGDQLHMALEMISQSGVGALVYLPQEGRGIGLVAKLKAYNLQDQGYDTVEANHKLGFKADQRDYMVGLQILKDLGLTKVRLLTNNPKKTKASVYTGVELEVVEQIPIIAGPEKHRERYMATKRDKMGHILPNDPNDSAPAD